MASMLSLRRSSGMLGLAVAAVMAVGLQAGPAQASRVGPKQYFTGVINGKAGNTTTPITIKIACSASRADRPPAARPDPGGPPTVPARAGSLGYTGKDSRIGVFFAAPPPGAGRLTPRAPRLPATTAPAAAHLTHAALLRNGHGLVQPDPGRPAVPVSHRPGPVRKPALSLPGAPAPCPAGKVPRRARAAERARFMAAGPGRSTPGWRRRAWRRPGRPGRIRWGSRRARVRGPRCPGRWRRPGRGRRAGPWTPA